MLDFSADIPPALHEADDILTRYGKWAAQGRAVRTCGSAEGDYRPGGGEALASRREAADSPLSQDQRLAAQRALARVPEIERVVLAVLYVPARGSIGARLRAMGVPPRLSQERHLNGLRIWWNLYQLTAAATCGRIRAT